MPPTSVCLISPVHDPDSRLLELLAAKGEALLKLYSGNVAVGISPTTSQALISLLKKQGFIMQVQRKDTIHLLGNNYLLALKLGLTTKATYLHLVDFDRALHWINRFPRELRDVISMLPSSQDFISFVRTKRAFQTHPNIQRSTESIVNSIASEVAGMDVDIMSGSFGFEKSLAKKIIAEVKQKDYGIYAEFLRIAIKHKVLISVIEVEGLEWETPDQYMDEIRQQGYAAWIQQFESLSQWEKRVKLVENSTDVLIKK